MLKLNWCGPLRRICQKGQDSRGGQVASWQLEEGGVMLGAGHGVDVGGFQNQAMDLAHMLGEMVHFVGEAEDGG